MRHETRVRTVEDFQFLKEDAAEVTRLRKKNAVSLNETERRQERDDLEAKLASREKTREAGKKLQSDVPGVAADPAKKVSTQDDGLQADERNLANELAAEKARKDAKDILLQEAAHILSDDVGLLKRETRVVARNRPAPPMVPAQKKRQEPAPAAVW